MKIDDIDKNPYFLCYYCKSCPDRVKCDSMEQNVFTNPVYRNCRYRDFVVRNSSYFDCLGPLFFEFR